MSQNEIIHNLGEPDRKLILDGKLLREIKDSESNLNYKKYRLVYFYDRTEIQVWFKDGKVTGASKNGVSIL